MAEIKGNNLLDLGVRSLQQMYVVSEILLSGQALMTQSNTGKEIDMLRYDLKTPAGELENHLV